MKGTLHKTGSGWQVWYYAKEDLFYGNTGVRILPLHPDDTIGIGQEEKEVEFEIIDFPSNSISKYAKLVDNPLTKNKTMQNEFITYEQALALKELGFDEPCMSSRDMNNGKGLIQIPLYQQAFRWFREKHELYQAVYADKRADDLTLLYKVHVYKLDEELSEYAYRWAKTYEAAEQACLDKLIEIVKNK